MQTLAYLQRKSADLKFHLAIAVFVLSLSAVLHADVIETITPAAGTNLSDIHVGDTIVLNTFLSSNDAGETFVSGGCCDAHLFGFFGFQVLNGGGITLTTGGDLSTTPAEVQWTLLAVSQASDDIFNGWSDCFPNTSSFGCAVTNLGAFRPADSNHLDFTIQAPVPEPATALLLATGLPLLRSRWRSRRTN